MMFRSKDYNPRGDKFGGANFVLYAFVTSAGEEVNAGTSEARDFM